MIIHWESCGAFESICVVLPITLRQMEVSIVDPPERLHIDFERKAINLIVQWNPWFASIPSLFWMFSNTQYEINEMLQVDECTNPLCRVLAWTSKFWGVSTCSLTTDEGDRASKGYCDMEHLYVLSAAWMKKNSFGAIGSTKQQNLFHELVQFEGKPIHLTDTWWFFKFIFLLFASLAGANVSNAKSSPLFSYILRRTGFGETWLVLLVGLMDYIILQKKTSKRIHLYCHIYNIILVRDQVNWFQHQSGLKGPIEITSIRGIEL